MIASGLRMRPAVRAARVTPDGASNCRLSSKTVGDVRAKAQSILIAVLPTQMVNLESVSFNDLAMVTVKKALFQRLQGREEKHQEDG